jgi:glycosyltransferase involved in cell wall biosynthesis
MINIGISALTRFHMFDLANELESRGLLGKVYTGYPRSRLPGPLRPHAFCRSLPIAGIAAAQMLGSLPGVQINVILAALSAFDRAVAKALQPHDIFIGLSGASSIRSFRRAKQLGARTICERGSSHIVFQDRILREEHERWGIPYRPIDQRVIDQELAEYDLCDQINVPSTFAAATFRTQGVPERKVFKNPYGVSLGLFSPRPKRDSVFRVLFVGALSIQKGLGYLFEAVRRLGSRSFEVWLIGRVDRNTEPFLRALPSNIRYLGPIPKEQLAEYYSQASVFVLPSIQEGLALVQAEAMACGIPVIATSNTGAADLFEDGAEGFIVPIRSSEAIAERLQELMDNPDLCWFLSQNALKRVRSIGGWRDYGARAARQCQLLLAS